MWLEHKKAKSNFAKELRCISKAYENEQILRTVKDAEIDRNSFWRVVKKGRNSSGLCTNAIKNDNDKAVYETEEILQAWQEHFKRICTPINDPNYDAPFYEFVSDRVRGYNEMSDGDQFTAIPFTYDEISLAISKLHLRKAAGYDNISSEQMRYARPNLIYILTQLFNLISEWEYIPVNFRRGTQVQREEYLYSR